MTREATRDAAQLLQDDEAVRARVADGDLSDFTELDLTEEEQAMLAAAADEFPEVAGFGFILTALLDPIGQTGPTPSAPPSISITPKHLALLNGYLSQP